MSPKNVTPLDRLMGSNGENLPALIPKAGQMLMSQPDSKTSSNIMVATTLLKGISDDPFPVDENDELVDFGSVYDLSQLVSPLDIEDVGGDGDCFYNWLSKYMMMLLMERK